VETKVKLTVEESVEIECFRKRREDFGYFISVSNVHNVPSFYPTMYKHIFSTETLGNNLFCLGGARYCDQLQEVVNKYEKALAEGYEVIK
jgi:hypothetical protein